MASRARSRRRLKSSASRLTRKRYAIGKGDAADRVVDRRDNPLATGWRTPLRRAAAPPKVGASPPCRPTSACVPGRHARRHPMPTAVATAAVAPFQLDPPKPDLDDLRSRIKATRWPPRETVKDASQGVQLATLQEVARYWGSDYDMGRLASRLNAVPQFMTEIDGLPIHFIHVKSKHEN